MTSDRGESFDPFRQLADSGSPATPAPRFAQRLRRQLAERLGLDPTDVPAVVGDTGQRRTVRPGVVSGGAVPYLCATDGAAALAFYAAAFGAEERSRMVGDDGRIGHAEFAVDDAVFYLSDEYPEIGVRSPGSLGGTTVTLHLTVGDVDSMFHRAVAAGAAPVTEPADQPHGSRHGVLFDPFGHRWMLSQPVDPAPTAHIGSTHSRTGGGLWAVVGYVDALAGIRFLVEVFGFEERLVVTDEAGTSVLHSELQWPEGGVVQVATAGPDGWSHPPAGQQGLYVVTAQAERLWRASLDAGLEVIRPFEAPDYSPDDLGFAVADREGNHWYFGSYGLGR